MYNKRIIDFKEVFLTIAKIKKSSPLWISTLFVILSSQLLYLILHLQFLLGMPQVRLAAADSLYFLCLGVGFYILSKGNKKLYFVAYAVILWPTVQLQYFFIKIFNKPFLFSELYKFPTLVQVSPLPHKTLYITLFILWAGGLIYLLYRFTKNWWSLTVIKKIIPLVILVYYVHIFTTTIISIEFWNGNTTRDVFFYSGILKTVRSREKNTNIDISPELVVKNFEYLRKKEKARTIYPISDSPITTPENKRPIFMFVFESFYDYKHFLPLFPEDPFPQEYRDLINSNTYTGPNQSYGSFDARFVSLTGSTPLEPPSRNLKISYQALPAILTQFGYQTTALESVGLTYSLSSYYPLWGFDSILFNLYNGNWEGTEGDIHSYEGNIEEIIQETPDGVVPFYFGFTFLGHGNSCTFTEKIEDPKENISLWLSHFKDQKKAKQLLKASIFNAQRFFSFKDIILKKYPNALIILKADHYSTELYPSINDDSSLPKEYKDIFNSDPNILPFVVVDGTNGVIPLPRGFSPANIPLMILAEAGLPYKDTTVSLLYREIPLDKINIYNKWYEKKEDRYINIPISETTNPELWEYNKAIETISMDLYKNNKAPLTLELLQQ